MKKIFFILCIGLVGGLAKAQSHKVGINTTTPTEYLDVNGTMRVRSLPADLSYKKAASGLAGGIPVVNSTPHNVVGQTTRAELVPNNTTTNFTTTNTSDAMFVIKRFKLKDWPSGSGDKGIDTTMSSTLWVAIMSNVGYSSEGNWEFQDNIFKEQHLHGWAVVDNGTTWRIWGDINGINEMSDYVDVLFVKKYVVAQDPRRENFKFDGQGAFTPTP